MHFSRTTIQTGAEKLWAVETEQKKVLALAAALPETPEKDALLTALKDEHVTTGAFHAFLHDEFTSNGGEYRCKDAADVEDLDDDDDVIVTPDSTGSGGKGDGGGDPGNDTGTGG